MLLLFRVQSHILQINTLILRLLPLQGEWRCGVVMFTQGAALGYVIIGLSARL